MRVIILGGGLTGLAAASKLVGAGADVTLIEAMGHVGGLAASHSWRGFPLDVGPHKLYPQNENIRSFLIDLLGEDLVKHEKRAGIWFRGRKLSFPPSPIDSFAEPALVFNGFFSYLRAAAGKRLRTAKEASYEDYVVNRFGRTLYEEVFKPQATKLWGPPAELSAELGRIRLPFPGLFEVMVGALSKSKLGPELSAKEFYYPKRGIGRLAERLAEVVVDGGGRILLGSKPTDLQLSGKGVTVKVEGKTLSGDFCLSTIAPDSLVNVLRPPAPVQIVDAAGKLKFRSLILCYLALGRPRLGNDHWIVFPEAKYSFNRIYEPRAFGVMGDNGEETVIAAEVTVDAQELWDRTDEEIADSVVSDLASTGLIRAGEVLAHRIIRIKRAYPLLDVGYEDRRRLVLDYLHAQPNLLCAGRSGLFIYDNMDHSLDMGLSAADHILDSSIGTWPEAARRFEGSRIID